ncbi:MutT/nudix family protein [Vibrio ichthyoenteri ATCC 700023]|uniref:MutT/nudix family protein n=1 Tax=Vibrio ichthyoenteri ATCC 700023 TaxID=870968 RepID=F9S743_9VIBR|nr:NUDIX hydrolase [Vibrio ichthyoenteri]EGU32023.1 MutT/nudix family protein [Vibrio ichthyoenteri ATCC 700023]
MKHLAMAVVIKQGKVLVQKRYRAEKGMLLEFPGGEVGEEETGTDAAIRELAEETGLLGLTHAATYSDVNDYGGRIYFVVLRAKQGDEPRVIDHERQQQFAWIEPNKIPLDDFYPADVAFITAQLKQYSLSPSLV